jgi:hypothetical protein
MPKAVIEIITPDKAAQLLQRNEANRPITKAVVARYAEEMRKGNWSLNGSSIAFDAMGNMTNGQHRCYACVEAGVPFQTVVLYDADENAFNTIDSGRNRTGSDILSLVGEKNVASLGGALNLIWKYEQGRMLHQLTPSRRDLLDVLNRHPNIRESVSYATKFNRSMSLATVAFLHYMGTQVHVDRTRKFMEQLRTGENLTTGSAALKLRDKWLVQQTGTLKGRARIEYKAAIGIKALNAALTGHPTTHLKFSTLETFPTIQGGPKYGHARQLTLTSKGK